jgi:hypothetical protein
LKKEAKNFCRFASTAMRKSFLVLFSKKGLLPFFRIKNPAMPPMRKKRDLPSKICAVCGRPFIWRKKWASVWQEVRYCSDACRRQSKTTPISSD